MEAYTYVALPLRVEEDPRDGSVTMFEAHGGVLFSDHSNDTPEGVVDWLARMVNEHALCSTEINRALRNGYENAAMRVKGMALTWPKDSAERKVLSDAARDIYSIVEEAVHARPDGSQKTVGSIPEHARGTRTVD